MALRASGRQRKRNGEQTACLEAVRAESAQEFAGALKLYVTSFGKHVDSSDPFLRDQLEAVYFVERQVQATYFDKFLFTTGCFCSISLKQANGYRQVPLHLKQVCLFTL